ncbi:MarR family transcriptional regulator [Solwaraspora sp. WMMD1047]|uniref:MarR family winged helix-turn-helix transcriptional regulator n=1 Tax=Solwaraspora sp. WMMD1047 TaxID=3016102 RepID=UPI002415C246|nr:MarR family transcriptional regulator [Solwaraspora sp. WMMD1047]MDG4830345.1 MarR family transcriptional regulator [Solwaraspora sp. WMMD1047]
MIDDPTVAAAAELADALGDLHRVLRRSVSGRLGRTPLPDAQAEVLRLVEREPGISVKEAADRLRTAPNTVSTLVGELAGAGLLERGRDPGNRRVVRLGLTALAHDRIAEYTAQRRELVVAALRRLDRPARDEIVRAAGHLRDLVDLIAVVAEPGGPAGGGSAGRDDPGGPPGPAGGVPD